MAESTRMLLGLAIGIILMIVLVSKTKVHTFIALLMAAMVTGLIGGMLPGDVTVDGATKTGIITAIQNGFGNTLRLTGIIIGLGVMMGGILEKSGAAEKMAYSFIQAVGKKKEEWALAITGWFIAIPVFADSAIVIFAPLCKAISKVTGKSLAGLALAMAAGLQLTHCLVPPTPGPTTAASMLGVDVGQMILMGAIISIPMLIVAVFYCMWIGKQIYQAPTDDGGFDRKEFKQEYIKSMEELDKLIGEKQLPSLGWSIAPIVVPLALILTKTVLDFTGHSNQAITFLGAPIVALGIMFIHSPPIPIIEKMEAIPVAGHDCMELNLSGARAPYFTRNIVILTDSNGIEGVGEVPGGEKIAKAPEDAKGLVTRSRAANFANFANFATPIFFALINTIFFHAVNVLHISRRCAILSATGGAKLNRICSIRQAAREICEFCEICGTA